MLSKEDVQTYIAASAMGAERCPVCGHDGPEVSGVPGTMGGCRLKQHVSCPDCGSTWVEVYHLADVELLPKAAQEGRSDG